MSKKVSARKIVLVIFIFSFVILDGGVLTSYVRAAEDAGDIQDKINKYIDKQQDVQKQLETSQTLLQKNQSQLNLTKNLLYQTENEMSRKEAELNNLNQRTELNKNILKNYIQQLYWQDQDPIISMVLDEKSLNDILSNGDQMISVKERINATIFEIKQSKADIEQAKNDLEDKKDDHEKLLSLQQGQQYEIKTDINQAQSTLSELNAKINKLRGELSSLLGSAVSFKNIMDAAAYAAKVTGIRKDYLLGVLVVESNLGRYTGGCNFKQSRMSGTRATIFKSICSDLKYDYNKMKVSCPPSGYRGTGGAMGVAQFMPDTWVGYKSRISSVTGHNPPDPWSLTDGVVAMALKLTQVSGVTAHKSSAEAKAYCIYLAGGNWAAYCDSKGVNYGDKVLYWADNYEKLMN
jgi:peptidoglycan hydrolase CwlO-like protein